MSGINFPGSLDSDSQIPMISDNITELGGDVINTLRSIVFAIEANIGIGAAGAAGSIAARLATSLDPNGNIIPSALGGIGLVYLPITDAQISPTANINESKLHLVYSTSSLYDLYTALKNSIDVFNGFLSLTGIKLEPHIDGIAYNHLLSAIFVDANINYLKINPSESVISAGTSVIERNIANAALLVQDISNDLVVHEKSDGSENVTAASGGTVPPENFAHVADGLYIDSSVFSTIPQTTNNLQSFAEYVDSSSLLLIGSRTQNLFSDGISRGSRSTSLIANGPGVPDGYGIPIIPPTPATAYLLGVPPGPMASSPVDNITDGDDVILFNPTATQLSTFNFDAQFSQVNPGDILTIDYNNGIAVQYLVDSTKAIIVGSTRTYAVRINGKNLFGTANASVRIDSALFNINKYGVLSTARAPNSLSAYESLIIANPRSAMAIGDGFDPTNFDSLHYNLYLAMFPGGNISNVIMLPAIDVTGNQGSTPGEYTLDIIIDNINTAFRQPGYNYRFIAFEYQGQFGIMLADPYNNTSFSIVGGLVNSTGNYTMLSAFPANVVDNVSNPIVDPLGIGVGAANIASPPPSVSYSSAISAYNVPTLIFYPLARNYFYTNGIERDRLKSDPIILNQISDSFGDGYWPATILLVQPYANRVQVTYQVNLDLITTGLEIGKTLVVQPAFPITDPRYNFKDYGRFTISNVVFNGCNTANPQTNITVYDAVHAAGVSPVVTSTSIPVFLYFSDDSVSFDNENVFDSSVNTSFKRFFEVYVDQYGHTFTHERARFSSTSSAPPPPGPDLLNINFYAVSPKLLGYPSANNSREIRLLISNYDGTTGIYSGQLGKGMGPSFINAGPMAVGKKGEITRFYDQTNIDYIDFIFDPTISVSSFSSQFIDIQLFGSLELDQEVMLVSTCQINDSTKEVSYLKDERQFGNTSEENFTTSAIDFIEAPTRLLQDNGVISGFDILRFSGDTVAVDGGSVLVNGKIIQINPTSINIPIVIEAVGANVGAAVVPGTSTVNVISWFLCVNDNYELELIADTDIDPTAPYYSTYGGFDSTRLFYVANPNLPSPSAYQIRGTYFSDLVINKKDVTPIALVTSTVTNPGSGFIVSTLNITDIRRFVSNGYGGLATPFTLGYNASFRSTDSLVTWLNQLNNLMSSTNTITTFLGNAVSNKVLIKGDFTISNSVSLDFNNNVIFEGDGGILTIAPAQGFVIGGNVTFNNIRFDYIYQPNNGSPDNGVVYSTNNLINSHNAVLYGNVGISITNITVTNCIFRSFYFDRYPFISFEFSNSAATVQNVNINNNQFISLSGTVGPNGQVDVRAAICFNNISTTIPTAYPYLPVLSQIIIENNICSSDQMFIITTPTHGGITNGPLFVCQNVKISGNTCGTIGFITGPAMPSVLDNGAYGYLIHNKMDALYIINNSCKYIANIDGYGLNVAFGSITTDTGPYQIIGNTCSWIHVGCSARSTTNAGGGIISKNIMFPYLTTFLLNFTASLLSPLNAAIFLNAEGTSVGNSQSIISENNITRKAVFNPSGISPFTPPIGNYTYDHGIYCFNNAQIINNIISGCITVPTSTPSAYMIYIGNTTTATVNVQGNILTKNGVGIAAYIGTFTNSATNNVTITDNIFDSIFSVNSTVYNDINAATGATNIPSNWTYTRNKNQISYASFSLYENLSDIYNIHTTYGVVNTTELVTAQSGLATTLVSGGGGWSSLSFASNIRLASILPSGVQVLYAIVGIYNNMVAHPGQVVTNSPSSISMSVTQNISNVVSPSSSPNNTIVDVAAHPTTYLTPAISPALSSLDLTTSGFGHPIPLMSSATFYLDISPTLAITGREYELVFNLTFTGIASTSAVTEIDVSPIVIQYAWV